METYIADTKDNLDQVTRMSASTTTTTLSDVVEDKFITINSSSESETASDRTDVVLTCIMSPISDTGIKKTVNENMNVLEFAPRSSNKSSNNITTTSRTTKLVLDDLEFVKRLGSGDIGTVYLVERKGSQGGLFAAKVMDKEELAYRNKESRAGTEREILEMLDHPFLPSLYASLDSPKWSCLLTEFCPGGDLHVLRQCQPQKRFNEDTVRFYTSEVVVALEYLHMLDVVYRDLKPENVLVRSDGHIMLIDFDLSLKCDHSTSTAQIVYERTDSKTHHSPNNHTGFSIKSCILPNCVVPRAPCIRLGRRGRKNKGNVHREILKIVAEPIEARSMSFVGTHEYLAPEIVSGEGHGNAVDWWTLGIFIYELFYGVTPFRGTDNEFTLTNIVARGLEFPKEPMVAPCAKDLISQLLNKDPSKRMGSMMGATAIKQHPFFEGVNWALLRCTKPPYVPRAFMSKDFASSQNGHGDANVDCY